MPQIGDQKHVSSADHVFAIRRILKSAMQVLLDVVDPTLSHQPYWASSAPRADGRRESLFKRGEVSFCSGRATRRISLRLSHPKLLALASSQQQAVLLDRSHRLMTAFPLTDDRRNP